MPSRQGYLAKTLMLSLLRGDHVKLWDEGGQDLKSYREENNDHGLSKPEQHFLSEHGTKVVSRQLRLG